MKLIDFLLSRQHGLSSNIVFENKAIFLQDINAVIELRDWIYCKENQFNDFISKYIIPKNDELYKRDRDEIRQNIPTPQILIQREGGRSESSRPLIAMYLYQKSQLTGDSLLHIRSINKFEQMWAPYFVDIVSTKRSNPKIFKKGFYEYCQSGDMEFMYNSSDSTKPDSGRLRILSFAFHDYVLLMYVFDNNDNELKQDDLNVFAESIKRTKKTESHFDD
jgi:hypothetical protein